MYLQTNSAYMLFYERIGQKPIEEKPPIQNTNDEGELVDESDMPKIKIELSKDLADVSVLLNSYNFCTHFIKFVF